MAHILRWSWLARPASASRKEFVLPSEWSCTKSKKYEPKPSSNVMIDLLSKRLAVELVDEIESILDTDNNYGDSRWVAEHMCIRLYNLDLPNGGKLDKGFIERQHQRGRVLRNQFLDAVPEIGEHTLRSTTEQRSIINLNGSIDFWQALFCFNAHRCDLIDSMEVFESPVIEDEPQYDTSIQFKRALFVNALRLREHTTAGVLMELIELLKTCPENDLPSIRKLSKFDVESKILSLSPKGETTCPYDMIFNLIRIIVSFLSLIRNLIRDRDGIQYYRALEPLYMWCSTRQPSCLALSARSVDPNGKIFDAIHRFESAIMGEYDMYAHLIRYLDEKDLSQKELAASLKKEMIIVNIALSDNNDEKLLTKNMPPKELSMIHAIWDHVPSRLLQSSASTAIIFGCLLYGQEKNKFKNNIEMCSNFVLDLSLLSRWKTILEETDPEIIKELSTSTFKKWDLPHDVEFSKVYKFTIEEDKKRFNGAIENVPSCNDQFDGLQFTIHALNAFQQYVTERGLE